MYCSIIEGECHRVARLFKCDYNLPLPIGAWRSPASALAWGARGRRFKSSRPDRQRLSKESLSFKQADVSSQGGRCKSSRPDTGLTITVERSIDGAAFAACTNAVTEV